jgi:hypothetical protein
MGTITLAQICDGIVTTLKTATGITTVLSYDELHPGPSEADLPLIQVYPQRGIQDVSNSTDATTFYAEVRQTEVDFYLDLLATQRSQLEEDMKSCVNGIDAIIEALEAEDRAPRFGLSGVRAYRWEWERALFDYGTVQYLGARFTLTIRVY